MRIAFIYFYFSIFYVKSQCFIAPIFIYSTHCSRGVKGMSKLEKRDKIEKIDKNDKYDKVLQSSPEGRKFDK